VLGAAVPATAGAADRKRALAAWVGRQRASAIALVLIATAVVLSFAAGPLPVAQATLNGLVAAAYIALGAVGLTLVFGVLRLVNFAHGDLMTFGAYVALWLNAGLALSFPAAVLLAVAATACLGVVFELALWRPLRARGAGTFQLLLSAIGAALLIRNGVQLVTGGAMRRFDVDITSSLGFLGLRIGTMQLAVLLVGLVALVLTGLMLRHTGLGRQIRAMADNLDLAETTGIDTRRIILVVWLLAAGLAGLAGALYAASLGVLTPNLGYALILSLFAAAILGGIGEPFGALAGAVVLALAQEWSALLINPRWKPAVGFAILLLTLLLLPRGLFGKRRSL
jgi:neutral amino acid transport system permease protein